MLWITLIVAVFATAIAVVLCKHFKIEKVYFILPIQFLAVFLSTWAFELVAARNISETNAVQQSLIIALLFSVGILILRAALGPLDSRKPGIADEGVSKEAKSN